MRTVFDFQTYPNFMEMFNVTLPVHDVSYENTLENTKSIKRIYLFIITLKLWRRKNPKNKLNSSSFLYTYMYSYYLCLHLSIAQSLMTFHFNRKEK